MSKKPSAPHDHTGVDRTLEFPPDTHMSGSASDVLIADWINGPLGKKHFSAWTADFQKKAIQECGLASSKYGNAEKRISILGHLASTKLPTNPTEVQRQIRLLGLPPSGSSSLKQFAFYLLSFLCEELPFPPWKPIPIISLAVPDIKTLCEQTRIICKTHIPKIDSPPFAYEIQDGKLLPLWRSRRQEWERISATLNTPDPSPRLVQLLQDVCAEYVKVANLVLAYNPKTHPKDLRCEIDAALWKVDRTYVPQRFLTFWNEECSDTITSSKRAEWRWLPDNLVIGCRRSLSSSVRVQLDVDGETLCLKVYVGDSVII